VVPSAAVQLSSDGEFLYVVKDGKTNRRSITIGPVMGDQTVITKGVEQGEQVVTRGIDHLREGSKVEVEKPASDGAKPLDQATAKRTLPATGNVTP
jgi:multidrug efflux system membrane fusion protein